MSKKYLFSLSCYFIPDSSLFYVELVFLMSQKVANLDKKLIIVMHKNHVLIINSKFNQECGLL